MTVKNNPKKIPRGFLNNIHVYFTYKMKIKSKMDNLLKGIPVKGYQYLHGGNTSDGSTQCDSTGNHIYCQKPTFNSEVVEENHLLVLYSFVFFVYIYNIEVQ